MKRLQSVPQPRRAFDKIIFTFPNIKAIAESTHSRQKHIGDTKVFDHVNELCFH